MAGKKHTDWRHRLGVFVEFDRYNRASRIYTIVITILTGVSLLPLCFKVPPAWVDDIQIPIGLVFLFDYVGRWMTADLRDTKRKGKAAFLMYPFEFWSIIDLLSLISFLPAIPTALRMIRLLRVTRLILIVELLRYSRGFYIMYEAINRERRALLAVVLFMLVYILAIALVMYSVEPDSFGTIFDALYWSATSLATIGYGDFAPQTMAGRTITFFSSIVGIAVVALPTGIITSAYVNTLNELRGRYSPTEQRESIIDKLAEQRAEELGIDIADITTDDLFGSAGRRASRDYAKKKQDDDSKAASSKSGNKAAKSQTSKKAAKDDAAKPAEAKNAKSASAKPAAAKNAKDDAAKPAAEKPEAAKTEKSKASPKDSGK